MFARDKYLKQLIDFKDKDFIKVITGVRRCGKSMLLKLYHKYLIESNIEENNIVYINLEQLEYRYIKDEDDFIKLILEKSKMIKGRIYFLLDEIQFVEGWQKAINSMRVSLDCDIVITGSNAKLLSGELATFLSGRYIEIKVYPLSFSEYLIAMNIDKNHRLIDEYYKEYEKYGGFPSVALVDSMIKDTIISGIFDSIVLNDIAYRGGVKDINTLRDLISYLSDNVGQLVNPTKINNILINEKVTSSHHTVNKYLQLLENAFLFYKVRQYDLRGKTYLKTNAKYFIVDSGLRRHAIGKKDGNYGNRLENIVFLELLRRGYSVDVGKIETKEIDFIARKLDEILYLQVCYQLPDNSHESDNLLNIKDNFKKIIITGRYFPEKQVDGIEIKYIVDWLLES